MQTVTLFNHISLKYRGKIGLIKYLQWVLKILGNVLV